MSSPAVRVTVLAIGFAFSAASPVCAGKLDEAVNEIARRVAQACRNPKRQPVTLNFRQPVIRIEKSRTVQGPARNMVSKLLAEALRDNGIQVRKVSGRSIIVGHITLDYLHDKEWLVTTIAAEVQDSSGTKIIDILPKDVEDISDNVAMWSIPVDIQSELATKKAGGDPEDPDDPVYEAIVNPSQPERDDGFILATPDSNFSMQILVDGRPLPVNSEDGIALVNLKKGDVFTVKIFNNWHHEVGVELLLDGISWRHRAGTNLRRLVPPGGTSEFRGWQIDEESIRAFKVVPYEDSIASELSFNDQVGAIQARFFASYRVDKDGKLLEDPLPGESGIFFLDRAIGKGKRGTQKIVIKKRKFGDLRASPSVRYLRP